MTQTLMPPFEDDESVFPATDKVLFLGGPKHGEELEVPRDERVWRMPVMPKTVINVEPSGIPLFGSGTAEVHTYVRRPIGLKFDEDTAFTRDVFVHESVPNQQIAQQLLMAALLVTFVKGGRRIIDGDGVSEVQQ
jgi:hypothetical protein